MNQERKPDWLLSLLASAREGEVDEAYIRAWVKEFNERYDAEHGPAKPLTDEDNQVIKNMLDKDRRGPMF